MAGGSREAVMGSAGSLHSSQLQTQTALGMALFTVPSWKCLVPGALPQVPVILLASRMESDSHLSGMEEEWLGAIDGAGSREDSDDAKESCLAY